MKRVAVLLFVLAGCGSDVEPLTPQDEQQTDWFTSIDAETGREFRCRLWWHKQGYGGGMASWCYEPIEGEQP